MSEEVFDRPQGMGITFHAARAEGDEFSKAIRGLVCFSQESLGSIDG